MTLKVALVDVGTFGVTEKTERRSKSSDEENSSKYFSEKVPKFRPGKSLKEKMKLKGGETVSKRNLRRLFHSIIVACLMFSIVCVNIPSRAGGYEPSSVAAERGKLSIVEGNPLWLSIIISIISEGLKMMAFGWRDKKKAQELENRLKIEIRKVTEDDLDNISRELKRFQRSLSDQMASQEQIDGGQNEKLDSFEKMRIEDFKYLKWLIDDLQTIVEQERRSREEKNAELAREVADFEKKVLEIIPDAEVIIPKLKEVLQEANAAIDKMEYTTNRIERIEADIASLRKTNIQQEENMAQLDERASELKISNDKQAARINVNTVLSALALIGVAVTLIR